jgi:hypothetical protein
MKRVVFRACFKADLLSFEMFLKVARWNLQKESNHSFIELDP